MCKKQTAWFSYTIPNVYLYTSSVQYGIFR